MLGALSTHPAAVSMFAAGFALICEWVDGNRVNGPIVRVNCYKAVYPYPVVDFYL